MEPSDWVREQPERINQWVQAHGGGRAWEGSYEAIALERNGVIQAGLVLYDYNSTQMLVNLVILAPELTRKLLDLGFLYCFHQLGLHRLTFIVSSGNLASIKLCLRLGAHHEATLREAGKEKEDLHIYALFRETCPYWSKLSGKIKRSAARG